MTFTEYHEAREYTLFNHTDRDFNSKDILLTNTLEELERAQPKVEDARKSNIEALMVQIIELKFMICMVSRSSLNEAGFASSDVDKRPLASMTRRVGISSLVCT